MNSQDIFPHVPASQRLLLISLSISAHLWACAAPPPPPPPKVTPTWSEVIQRAYTKPPRSSAPKSIKITHELWTPSSSIPPSDRVEVTLAKTGVLAELNGSEGQYEISVGPHQCQTRWSPLDSDAQRALKVRLDQCYSQLSPEQRVRLSKSTHRMLASCEGEGLSGLVEVNNVVVSLSKALETPRAKEGEAVKSTDPVPIWVEGHQMRCGFVKKQHRYLTKDHISYERARLKSGTWLVWTRGMSTFGLPELSLGMVEASMLSAAEEKLLALADNAIRIEGVVEGQNVESGLAQAMYVKAHRAAQYIKELASAPGGALESLMIVDVNAPADHTEALMKMTGRFARP